MVNRFDVRIQILFCNKHKKIFEEKVKVKLENNKVGIRPLDFLFLWRDSEGCLACEWKTTFGKNVDTSIHDGSLTIDGKTYNKG